MDSTQALPRGYSWEATGSAEVDSLPLCAYCEGTKRPQHHGNLRVATSGKTYCETHLPGGVRRVTLLMVPVHG